MIAAAAAADSWPRLLLDPELEVGCGCRKGPEKKLLILVCPLDEVWARAAAAAAAWLRLGGPVQP